MKKIILKDNGQMTKRDQSFFGGKFSFLERIKIGGIGSAKVIYQSGLDYFDELNQHIENEISFANFELLKNGLLIRLNRNQRLRYVGYQLNEVLSVSLVGTLIGEENKQSYAGQLRLNMLEGEQLQFRIQSNYFYNIKSFFEKSLFENKLTCELITTH